MFLVYIGINGCAPFAAVANYLVIFYCTFSLFGLFNLVIKLLFTGEIAYRLHSGHATRSHLINNCNVVFVGCKWSV